MQEFWDGDERPANWPDAIPWPVQIEELPLDWVRKRREELGLSEPRSLSIPREVTWRSVKGCVSRY